MNTRKHRLSLVATALLAANLGAAGQSLTISGKVTRGGAPVVLATVHLSGRAPVPARGCATDTLGLFTLPGLVAGDYTLLVTAAGLEPREIAVQNLVESLFLEIALEPREVVLEGVTVQAPRGARHRVIFPTRAQRDHSANALQLLNALSLPGVRVNPLLNTVTATGGAPVILQVDGVEATVTDVMTLRPRQVKRVEYIDRAGVRHEQATRVINHVTARGERGVAGGVDLMNSLDAVAGGDVVFLKYNRRRSALSLDYTVAFQHLDGNHRERAARFLLADSTVVTRLEASEGGRYVSRVHDLAAAFAYRGRDSSLFNARVAWHLTDRPRNDFYNRLAGEATRVADELGETTRAPAVDLYYRRESTRGRWILTLAWNDARTTSRRDYREHGATAYRRQLHLRARKVALAAGVVRERPLAGGILALGVLHDRSRAMQEYRQETVARHVTGQAASVLFAGWRGEWPRWSLDAGARACLTSFRGEGRRYYSLLPRVAAGYRAGKASFLRLETGAARAIPTLIQRLDVEVRVDSLTSERGNPALVPAREWTTTLAHETRGEPWSLHLALEHHHKRRPVMEAREEVDGRFVTMPRNMRRWDKYSAELTGKTGMVRDAWQLSLTGGASLFDSRGDAYRHRYAHLYYSVELLVLHRRWMLVGQARGADGRLDGETVTRENNYHYLALQYNGERFSAGLGAFNPFGNETRGVTRNRNARAPFSRVTYSDAARTVVVTLTWSFSSGAATRDAAAPAAPRDTDRGVRDVYK